ncbi:DUF378 domain-containing protein [Candidatus Falkowbacteria bacterium]|nr:DUF378 domain-containing protein [Candidatus Falkowbacteria bacterium]
MKALHMITWILLLIGGLNWLAFGLFGWDVGQLFGGMDAWFSRLVYILVGLSALFELFTHKAHCKYCSE